MPTDQQDRLYENAQVRQFDYREHFVQVKKKKNFIENRRPRFPSRSKMPEA